jgi:hypothetical protein
MPTYEEEKKENLEAYERLKSEIHTKYKGQYIAIAVGRLINVSPSFDESSESVKGYRHALVFQGGEKPIIGPLRVRVLGQDFCLADFIRVQRNDQNEYRVEQAQ